MATVTEKTMDKLQLERTLARRRFSICANKLEEYLQQKEMSHIYAEFKKLSKYYDNLVIIQNKYFNLYLESESRDEKVIEKDSDSADEYESKWYYLEQKVKEVTEVVDNSVSGSKKTIKEASSFTGYGESPYMSRHLRLPKLELPKFNGEISKWLTFWAQYKKIDSDEKIDNEDKFQYLIQSMEVGTSARELVESFPPTADNYPKVLEQLKQRFARDDIIIEHYVRELLQLTLAQSKGSSNAAIGPLYDRIITQILALESLGVTQDKYASFLYPMVESALPVDTLRAWSRSHMQTEKGSQLAKLLNFLKLEVESEERIQLARNKFTKDYYAGPSASCFTATSKNDRGNRDQTSVDGRTEKIQPCIWCDKISHTSSECTLSIKMTLDERRSFLKRKNACYICLKIGHMASKCRKHVRCVACQRRHYPVMCESLIKCETIKAKSADKINEDQTMLNQSASSKADTVLLQTLMVNVEQGNDICTVRALLDSGAQRSFIKKSIAEQLKMRPLREQEMSHTLFGGVVTKKQIHKVYEVNVANLDGSYRIKIDMLGQDNICGYLPKIRQGKLLYKLQQKGIQITDCVNNVNEISLLIGSDVLGTILTGQSVRVDDSLLAMKTGLGWTVQGPAVGVYCSSNVTSSVSALSCSFDIDDLWKLETLRIMDDTEVKAKSRVEDEVVNFFERTIKVNNEGRYEVMLPRKPMFDSLSTNYVMAEKRLRSTTKKLVKLGILEDYSIIFQEWLDSGIIEEVLVDNIDKGHYMPHHAVVKESSLTTKIRPVFDASASEKNGLSLNDCLEKGANFIEVIPKLLINFRLGKIGITADIKKAFLQISVSPADRDFLKFLWWRDINNVEKGSKTYRHCRVVFGVTTSPFLLSATILHHLNKYDNEVALKLRNGFYVDNCVVSVNSEEEMKHFIEEAKKVMKEGNFELRCWVTGPIVTGGEENCISVLGMTWDPVTDELYCKVPTINDLGEISKRKLLSIAQSIFDPLGLFCPVTLVPKLILQECWVKKLDWDSALPTELMERMNNWLKYLNNLKDCKVPRVCQANILFSENSLHIFSDASQSAYSVCIFLRSKLVDFVSVQLLMAKSRVTPTKSITIPRLELIAAVLGTRLASEIKKELKVSYKEYYWSDSSKVLAWIRRKVSLNVFVHNRVTEIVRRTNIEGWRHVPGETNPADLPSRGCNALQLLKSRWWEGPAWLKKSPSEWPISDPMPNEEEVGKEVKKNILTVQVNEKFSDRLHYFGKYTKIVRMVAWCFRFLRNCRRNNLKRSEIYLTGKEYEYAEKKVLELLQKENQDMLDKLNIRTVHNKEGLLCVKTRLTLREDSENFKYPVLLPSRDIIVHRLVIFWHLKNRHAGSQTLINNIREDYWIIGIRRLAKKTVRECVICRRHSAKPCGVPPSPLPLNRITCGNAFEVSGVDLAGPLQLRTGEKCWVVLFTCATYRAVHLEITLSLSTEDFLLALKRFIARRGNVKVMYSDNGTNFRGTKNVLDTVDWEDAAAKTSAEKMEWRFIPPQAPWWGGFWERIVGLMKNILRRMLGKASLSQIEMYTALCEVEAVINARPITYISDSTENLKPLTPSMFLCNRLENNSNLGFLDAKSLTVRWRYIQKLLDDLKIRFRSEYLAALVEKKGANSSRDVNIGDLVLIGSDGLKRINWPLGLVINIYKGVDGLCRVARLKTSNGEIVRPLQRLFPLEVSVSKEQDTVLGYDFSPGLYQPNETKEECYATRSGRPIKIPVRLDL